MKHSVSGGEGYPYLLQEEEENLAQDSDNDADLNVETNKSWW